MDAYQKAVKLLKIRPHHSAELTKKLLLRGFDRTEVADVITKLTESGLIDNSQFAQNYLAELLRNKTLGYYGLKVKLLQRGVASKEADQLLKEHLPLTLELQMAKGFVSRFPNEDRKKLAMKLQRKGFRTEVIGSILRQP